MFLSTLQLLLLLFTLAASWFVWFRSWASTREIRKIPGTTGWPLIGETVSFISEFSSPSGIYSVFLTGREASKILLSGKDGTVTLNLSYAGKQVLGPTSLLTTNGEEHKRLRRLIGDPLSIDALKKYFEFIDDLAIETLDKWPGRTVFVHLNLLVRLQFTLKVIGNMIMSLEPCGEEQEKFRSDFKHISSTFASLPLKIPGFKFHRGQRRASLRTAATLFLR